MNAIAVIQEAHRTVEAARHFHEAIDEAIRLCDGGPAAESWAEASRHLQRSLSDLFGGAVPADLEAVTGSLRPDDNAGTVLQKFRETLDHIVGRIEDAHRLHQDRVTQATHDAGAAIVKRIDEQSAGLAAAQAAVGDLDGAIDDLEQRLAADHARSADLQQRWQERWTHACPDIEPADAPAISGGAVDAREREFRTWCAAHGPEWTRRRRWQPIIDVWVTFLADPASAKSERIKGAYVKHANVVGVTCTEAGNHAFYGHAGFEPYDLVIADEVSRATLPELVLAAQLGRVLALVGDPRQLWPMLPEIERAYAESADDAAGDVERFRKLVTASLFAELFRSAPEAMRQTLLAQYRMHPQIMAVVNLFYEGRLINAQ